MPYAAVAHGMFEGIDYRAERPFMDWRRPDLLTSISEWLSLNPPRLELSTLALDELERRGATRAMPARRLFDEAGLKPIPWLRPARELVLSELAPSTTPRRRGRLYIILRDGYTDRFGTYGAYVGVTGHRVETRFIEHRTGVRSARGLPEHGIELLYSLFVWANPIPGGNDLRQQHETSLHRLLARVVPRVTGDTVPLKKQDRCSSR